MTDTETIESLQAQLALAHEDVERWERKHGYSLEAADRYVALGTPEKAITLREDAKEYGRNLTQARRAVDSLERQIASHAARLLGAKGASKGGQSTSDAKRAASRENGKKGGRPRKPTTNPEN